MKRPLCALLSALLLFILAACGAKPSEEPPAQPPVEQPGEIEPPTLTEAEQSLADLRETLREAGAVLGVAYLGSTNGSESIDLSDALSDTPYPEAYLFLRDISSDAIVTTGGWDIYCLVPADADAKLTVNEFGWLTEGAELPEAGGTLYQSESGAPVCLIANVSDIMPDTQVTVTAADGTSVTYQPFLSLMDGSVAADDPLVYDFTIYPDAQ